MSDQASTPEPPQMLLVKRLTYLAGALRTDPVFSTVVLNRFMYLVTDQEQFNALVSQYRAAELDIAVLRAVADALEAAEAERIGRAVRRSRPLL